MLVKSMRHLFAVRMSYCPEGDDPAPTEQGGGDPDGIESVTPVEGKVGFESYDKAVKAARNRGERLKAVEAEKIALAADKARIATELARYQEADRVAAEKKARDAGEFDKVLGVKDQRIAELEGIVSKDAAEKIEAKKYYALERALQTKIPDRFRFAIDLDRVQIATDGKTVLESSLTAYVAELKATYPEMIGKRKGPGDEPPGDGGGEAGTVLYNEWLKMPYSEQKKIPPSRIEGHPANQKQ